MHSNSSLRFVATTDKGLRQSNADAVFAGDKIFAEEFSAGKNKLAEKALFVVAEEHVLPRLLHAGRSPKT